MAETFSQCAVTEKISKGRKYKQQTHKYRGAFERDRDRIIHSEAFRRLEGKMQVFTPGLNDSYRNRLTHSIEVSQIGRTIARILGLNENLAEAVCLGHDLGHPPFGHSGEEILNGLMEQEGGFEHNEQGLRIVDLLEHPYPGFAGLNLMYETRLGLARHNSPFDKPKVVEFDETNCSLEGQAAAIADRIAYNCHDLEDGMRSGLIDFGQIEGLGIMAEAQQKINADSIDDLPVRGTRTAKAIIDILVSDCIETSREKIASAKIKSVEDVYRQKMSLICLSDLAEQKLIELEKFLFINLYRNVEVTKGTDKIRKGLERLFVSLTAKPDKMTPFYCSLVEEQGLARIVCDYIAGMTDRFCLKMIEEL